MKLIILFFILVISCLFNGLVAPVNGYADVITLRADRWYPYNSEPDSEKPGYTVEIAECIFKKAGHQIDYKLLNWARTCIEVISGKWDGALGGAYQDIPDAIFPEEEIGVVSNTFFVKKGTAWKYSGIDSLKTVKVGIIKGYSYGCNFDKYFESEKSNLVQVVYGDNPLESNIKKLLINRVDVVVEDKAVFEATAHKMGVHSEISIAGNIPSTKLDRIFIAFSPKNPKSQEYARIVTEGIREIRANGKLKEILKSYGLNDWKNISK